MVDTRDSRVDDYLRPLPDWQQEIFEQVRVILHEADPELTETIKRTVQPYFVLDGNVAAFLATKDHVNIFVYDGGIVPDPHGLVTSGHDNVTSRCIAFWEATRFGVSPCWSSSATSSPTIVPVDGASSRTSPDDLESPPRPAAVGRVVSSGSSHREHPR